MIGMLELMEGGQRLNVSIDAESAARAGALSCFKNGSYYILLYNHRPWRTPSIPEQIDLTLKADILERHRVDDFGVGNRSRPRSLRSPALRRLRRGGS